MKIGEGQVLNFKLFQEAICMNWLNDWIVQEDEKLLYLEGFNMKFDWHVYLFHDKCKVNNPFIHHFVRKNILEIWQKYKLRINNKIPL